MDSDRWARKWLPTAGAAIGVALIGLPILAIAVRALLVSTDAGARLSIGNFIALFSDGSFYEALLNTLIAGLCTAAFSLVLGFSLAFLVARTDMPARRLLGAANIVPFFLSPYAAAIGWTWLLAPHGGLATTWLSSTYHVSLQWLSIYSVAGVVLVQTLAYTPYVFLFLLPPLREMDAAFEDTARVHGASFCHTLFHITLPLVLPALLSAALIVFVTSAGMLDVPFALGSQRSIRFIPSEILAIARPEGAGVGDVGRAAAFGVVALLLMIGPAFWQRRFLSGRQFEVISTAGYRYRVIRLPWPAKLAALALEAFYIGFSVLVPLAILLMVSLTKLWTGHFNWRAATTINYHFVLSPWGMPRAAIEHTLLLAATCATIGVALAVPQSWFVNAGPLERRARAEMLLYIPLAIASVVVGLGFLLLSPRALQGASAIMLLAFLARYLPFVTRDICAVHRTIDPDLEQISRGSGASWGRTLRHVMLPLLRPSLFGSWLVLFVICVRELGAAILLHTQGTETISVAMVALYDSYPGRAAALAVVQMAILSLVFAIFMLSRVPLPRRPA